jgi:hypothetical protein
VSARCLTMQRTLTKPSFGPWKNKTGYRCANGLLNDLNLSVREKTVFVLCCLECANERRA